MKPKGKRWKRWKRKHQTRPPSLTSANRKAIFDYVAKVFAERPPKLMAFFVEESK